MYLRLLLTVLYIIIPLIIIFIITTILNLSQKNQIEIDYIIDTGSLINPENIYYTKPEDILYLDKYYLSSEVLELMYFYGYSRDVNLTYDFKDHCKLDFEFDKQQVDYINYNEFRLSFIIENFTDDNIIKAQKCIDEFVTILNDLLFYRYNLDDILERIDYNLTVLNFVMDTRQNQFLLDTENYYFETKAKVIINSLLIIENLISETIDKLNKEEQNSNILDEVLKKLLKQKNILNSFDQDTKFTSEFSEIDPSEYRSNEQIYYRFLINKLEQIKEEITMDKSNLKVRDVFIKDDGTKTLSIFSPGFVIFIVMISALLIILIETFYRRFIVK